MKKFNLLSRAEMKKVMGGVFDPESIDGELGAFGKCTVKTTCATGSVECTSDSGKCRKGDKYVQCDSDAYIYC